MLKKGSGMHLWDIDKNRYLDFTSCFGVAALGHRPKKVQHALREQSAKLIHGMGDVHPNESKIKLLGLLATILPYRRPNILFSSTGSEAVDAALKTAVLATGKTDFISFQGAYHGLLTAPLRLTNRKIFTSQFEQWMGITAKILPFPARDNDEILNRLEDELKTKKYAGIVMEPVQGRGGDRSFADEFLRACAMLAKKHQTLLIFDEIFTGFGRTGKLFACEHSGVVPDIICLGKALGGGLPLSLVAGDILEVWGKSSGESRHTSTFLGHPLACATGHAAIREIIARLPSFVDELKEIDVVLGEQNLFDVSGRGFMRGLRFKSSHVNPVDMFTLTKKLLKNGIMVMPSGEEGDVLSLTPPLIAKAKDFRYLLKAIEEILD